MDSTWTSTATTGSTTPTTATTSKDVTTDPVEMEPVAVKSIRVGSAFAIAWQRFSLTRMLMRASCVIVTVVLCFFVALPLLLLLFPNICRTLLFFDFFPPTPSFEIPPSFKGRNFYVPQGNTLLGVWHLVPSDVVGVDSDEEYDAFLANTNYSIMLFAHGNFHDRSDEERHPKYEKLLESNLQLIVLDYRGFGDSAGAANGRSAAEDVLTVFHSVIEPCRGDNEVFMFGHSLGTAITLRALHRIEKEGYEIDGLILDAPLYSTKENAKSLPKYSVVVGWWLPDIVEDWMIERATEAYDMAFESYRYLAGVKCPVLLLVAEEDFLTPSHLVKRLHDYARSENNETLVFYMEFRKCFEYGHLWLYTSPEFPEILERFFSVIRQLNDHQQNET